LELKEIPQMKPWHFIPSSFFPFSVAFHRGTCSFHTAPLLGASNESDPCHVFHTVSAVSVPNLPSNSSSNAWSSDVSSCAKAYLRALGERSILACPPDLEVSFSPASPTEDDTRCSVWLHRAFDPRRSLDLELTLRAGCYPDLPLNASLPRARLSAWALPAPGSSSSNATQFARVLERATWARALRCAGKLQGAGARTAVRCVDDDAPPRDDAPVPDKVVFELQGESLDLCGEGSSSSSSLLDAFGLWACLASSDSPLVEWLGQPSVVAARCGEDGGGDPDPSSLAPCDYIRRGSSYGDRPAFPADQLILQWAPAGNASSSGSVEWAACAPLPAPQRFPSPPPPHHPRLHPAACRPAVVRACTLTNTTPACALGVGNLSIVPEAWWQEGPADEPPGGCLTLPACLPPSAVGFTSGAWTRACLEPSELPLAERELRDLAVCPDVTPQPAAAAAQGGPEGSAREAEQTTALEGFEELFTVGAVVTLLVVLALAVGIFWFVKPWLYFKWRVRVAENLLRKRGGGDDDRRRRVYAAAHEHDARSRNPTSDAFWSGEDCEDDCETTSDEKLGDARRYAAAVRLDAVSSGGDTSTWEQVYQRKKKKKRRRRRSLQLQSPFLAPLRPLQTHRGGDVGKKNGSGRGGEFSFRNFLRGLFPLARAKDVAGDESANDLNCPYGVLEYI
jgi:hypothetical protein